jgi:hypothetical protein
MTNPIWKGLAAAVLVAATAAACGGGSSTPTSPSTGGGGTTNPPTQADVPLFPEWSFWQWSDGTDAVAQGNLVPGIAGSPDRDVFSGTLTDLANYRLQITAGDADFAHALRAGEREDGGERFHHAL